jgi:allophanate hydrolase subunit 2
LFTTIQDMGRWGYQDRGVPVAGPMDIVCASRRQCLVGNSRDAATLEARGRAELRFEQATVVAVTGADLGASIDDATLPPDTPRSCAAGAVPALRRASCGTRGYIACDGGIAVPLVLGSRSTHVLSGLGGVDGRALSAGCRVPLGDSRTQRVRAAGDLTNRGATEISQAKRGADLIGPPNGGAHACE